MATKKYAFTYKLGKMNRSIVFQVLEQVIPEEAKVSKINGIDICAVAHPEIRLSENSIFLRGSNKEWDHRVDVEYFSSNTERDDAFKMIIETLVAWGAKFGIDIT